MPGRRTLQSLVVLALLAGTGVVSYVAYQDERDNALDADRELAERAAAEARADVTSVASGLRGAAGVVNDDGSIDAQRFNAFAREVVERSSFLGVSWAPTIRGDERAEFEERLGGPITRLGATGDPRPLTEERDAYAPLALTWPDTAKRRQFLGFDSLSDPVRRTAARTAIRTSEPQLSGPLKIPQTGQEGTALFAPVARRSRGRLGSIGLMVSGLPGDAIASTIRRRLDLDEAVAIHAGGERITRREPAGETVSTQLTLFGRRWEISLPATASVNVVPAIAYGVSGLALTLVAAGAFALASRRERDLQRRQTVSEVQAARESLLIRITEVMEREIEAEARLRSLAQTLVPAVGDVCTVHEVSPEGVINRVGVASVDPRVEDLVNAMPRAPERTSPIRAAVTSREPVLYTRIAENREAERRRRRGIEEGSAPGPRSPLAVYRSEQRSNMIVPLVARGKVLGTISVSILNSSGRPPFDRDDLTFGMEVATHAAMALDNARLYEQQRDIAVILQGALLPRTLPEVEGAEVAVRHRPGRSGTEVGGDFYDLFQTGDRWIAVVGDVCGKGPEAASLTALVRHTLRATARLGPQEAVLRVHEAIQASGENTYCTLCCVELRRGQDGLMARVTTAGHPEPLVRHADGTVERLDVTGPLVGVLTDPVFEAQEVRLPDGSLFFMCSDGVPEARRNGEIFGDQRLEDLLSSLGGLDPEALLERVEDEVLSFVKGRPRDDLALFALRVGG
jgi:serine phosphatase RsbU (regulator of sigma subunit)/CHASE1-domain containing sensor protein